MCTWSVIVPHVFLSSVQKENHCSSSQALHGGEGGLSGQLSFWSGSVDGIVPLVRVFPLKERSRVASMCQQSVSCRDAVSVRLTCDLGQVQRPRGGAPRSSLQGDCVLPLCLARLFSNRLAGPWASSGRWHRPECPPNL